MNLTGQFIFNPLISHSLICFLFTEHQKDARHLESKDTNQHGLVSSCPLDCARIRNTGTSYVLFVEFCNGTIDNFIQSINRIDASTLFELFVLYLYTNRIQREIYRWSIDI